MDEIVICHCKKHNEWYSNNCSNCMVDDNEEDIRQKERERIGDMLSVSENELGFIEISNHIPYKYWNL